MTSTNVLLVEDEELNRALVRAILDRSGEPAVRQIQLIEAPTLAAARDALARCDIDVVLLDLNLPDGNGLILAAELAAARPAGQPDGSPDGKPAGRPEVIAMTASVLPQERAAAIEAGCDGFLDKPYVAADLVKMLAAHLARRRPAG